MSMCPTPLGDVKALSPSPDPVPQCTHDCFDRWIECQRYAAKPMTPEELSNNDRHMADAIAHRR